MSSQNYNLNDLTDSQPKSKIWPALVKLVGLLPEKRGQLILALMTMVCFSILSMLPPALIGYTVNHLIADKVNIRGLSIQTTFISKILHGTGYSLVLTVCGWLLVIYLLNLVAVYMRTILMGGFGQHLLFTLRNAIFNKLQEMPVAFF